VSNWDTFRSTPLIVASTWRGWLRHSQSLFCHRPEVFKKSASLGIILLREGQHASTLGSQTRNPIPFVKPPH
jgi:hypothetical protein